MSINNEGTPAPKSESEIALAELEKEGQFVEGKEPPAPKEEPKAPTPPKEEKKEEVPPEKEEPKTPRTPQMVETWKLRVAEEQKADLQARLDELSKQKDPISKAQKEEISDDVEAVIKKAEEAGTDGTFLREFAKTILNKAKPSDDILKTFDSIKQERELEKQLNAYQSEFDKDVLPLVKDYNLSDTALSELKKTLKDYAFSETYAKVPLKEIFKFKESGLDLKAPKRSSESKSVKTRATDVVDLENLDEDSFKNLSDKQVEEFASKRSSGGWNSNKK